MYTKKTDRQLLATCLQFRRGSLSAAQKGQTVYGPAGAPCSWLLVHKDLHVLINRGDPCYAEFFDQHIHYVG